MRVNHETLASVNQHRHHQPCRDILILIVARLSSRLSRHKRILWVGKSSLLARLRAAHAGFRTLHQTEFGLFGLNEATNGG
jgi:hypothetical protein